MVAVSTVLCTDSSLTGAVGKGGVARELPGADQIVSVIGGSNAASQADGADMSVCKSTVGTVAAMTIDIFTQRIGRAASAFANGQCGACDRLIIGTILVISPLTAFSTERQWLL